MHHSGTVLVPAKASSHTPTISLESEMAQSNARLGADSSWPMAHLDLHSIPRSTVQYTSSIGNAPLVGDASLQQPERNGHSQLYLLSDVHESISDINAEYIALPLNSTSNPEEFLRNSQEISR